MKELHTIMSTIEYIRKKSIFKYLDNYQMERPDGERPEHAERVRGILKKRYPIYTKRIELWEVLHGKRIMKPWDTNR